MRREWIRLSNARRSFVAAALLSVFACTGNHDTSTQPTKPTGPAALTIVSGDNQVAEVGTSLSAPVRVLVTDSAGRAISGAPVRIVEIVNGNSYGAQYQGVSDSSGIASIEVQVGQRPGDYLFELSIPGALRSDVHLRATAVAGPPTKIDAAPINGCCRYPGSSAGPPTFTVTDRFANAVANTPVTFTSAPAGTVSDSVLRTDSLGQVTPRWWLLGSEPGTYTLTASAGNAQVSVRATVSTGLPAKLVVKSGDHQQVGADSIVRGQIILDVVDSAGQGVEDYPVVFTDESSGAIVCTTGSRFGEFYLTCPWRVGAQPGVEKLRVTAGTAATTLSALVLQQPAALEVITDNAGSQFFAPGTTLTNGIAVRLTLPGGAAAAGYTLLVSGPRNSASTPNSVTTDAQGIAVLSWMLPDVIQTDTLSLVVGAFPAIRRSFIANVVGQPKFWNIAAGNSHTCATTRGSVSANVLCWGNNSQGALGDGTTTSRLVPTPTLPVPDVTGYFRDLPMYAAYPAAGDGFTCIRFLSVTLNRGGLGVPVPSALRCWGANGSGQTGSAGTATGQQNDLGGMLDRVTAGASHACAVQETSGPVDPWTAAWSPVDDAIVCWGDNRFGQLGDGTTVSRSTPVRIGAALTGQGTNVGAGDGFTCAINSDGRAFCWGHNSDGQLGNNATTDQLLPFQVSGSQRYTTSARISVGTAHACAIGTDSLAYCWGRNSDGQLGDGSTINRTYPVAVSGNIHFVTLTAGGAHTCGLTASNATYCWGSNQYGQLGIGGGPLDVMTPTLLQFAPPFDHISAGGHHTCALAKADGRAYCWGLNVDGQLGNGTRTNESTPTPIANFRSGVSASMSRARRP